MSKIAHSAATLDRRTFVEIAASCTIAIPSLTLGGCSLLSEAPPDEIVAEPPSAKELLEQKIEALIANMSIEQKAAQLLILRPEVLTELAPVTLAGEDTRLALSKHPVGGLTYFGQNLLDSEQTQTMLANTTEYCLETCGIPPFLCIDEEGGTVSRIGGNPGFGRENVGNMADIGAAGDVAAAESSANYIAEYLSSLGFNVDFAPVADIVNNPKSEMLTRSFGSDPQLVAQMVCAQIECFRKAGILCAAKHFPGIGNAQGDSHNDTIISERTLEQMQTFELVPFKAAIEANVPFVMVGHLSVPAITGGLVPASLSASIVTDLLRKDLGYEGLIITDSLGMGAVSAYHGTAESVVMAIAAGCDIALMPPYVDDAVSGICEAVSAAVLTEERINQSLRRILRVKMSAMGEYF